MRVASFHPHSAISAEKFPTAWTRLIRSAPPKHYRGAGPVVAAYRCPAGARTPGRANAPGVTGYRATAAACVAGATIVATAHRLCPALRQGRPPRHAAHAGAWIAESDAAGLPCGCAITDKKSGHVSGGLSLLPLPASGTDLEIGWQMGPAMWGHGYSAEPVTLSRIRPLRRRLSVRCPRSCGRAISVAWPGESIGPLGWRVCCRERELIAVHIGLIRRYRRATGGRSRRAREDHLDGEIRTKNALKGVM
jgi:hypothetical protein